MKTRGKDRRGSSARAQASAQQPETEVRRSMRKSAATPAGTLDSPDNVLKLQFDSAGPTKPVGNKSKSRISSTHKKAKAPSKPAPAISILTPACLIEIFKLCDQRDRKLALPLVCKHWRELLHAPGAWETLSIDNSSEYDIPRSDGFSLPPLSFAKVLKWIKPRAKGVENLTVTYNVWKNGTQTYEPSNISERSFRAILKAVAPTLESLQIHPEYEGFGFPLRWSVLKDIAAAEYLKTLQLYFVDDGNLTASHVEDIKKFKSLEHLALRWAPCYDEEVSSGERTIMAAPTVTNPDGTTTISTEPTVPLNLFDMDYLESLHLESEWLNGPFPKELEKLTLLEDLALGWQNLPKLEYIPVLLKKLSLRGSNNGQSIVNNGLGYYLAHRFPDVKELDLSHCNLKSFNFGDDEYDDETINVVEILDLSHNNFGPLPQINFIGDMWKLKRLDLSFCGLSLVPDSVVASLDSLENLNLNHNNLVDLPQEFMHMNRLDHLDLCHNSFPAIPEVLKKMSSLRVIDLNYCRYLEHAKSLTEWLLGTTNLSSLRMGKGYGGGKYHESSTKWLEEAARELANVGRGDVLKYTRG